MAHLENDAALKPLRDYICNTLLDGREIARDENLLLSGLLDSLGVMSLVTFIETKFAIEVPFEDVVIENFATLDAMTNYIALSERTHA